MPSARSVWSPVSSTTASVARVFWNSSASSIRATASTATTGRVTSSASLADELIDDLLGRITALGRPPGGVLIESLHGAPKEVDSASAALGYRDAAFNISAMASWIDPAHDEESIAWARETAAAIEPWSVSGGYANYMQADEPIDRVRAAFGPDAFARLQALKSRYDPNNALRRNQNIPPAG